MVMAEVRKIETRKRVNMETIQHGPVGVAKDTKGLVKKKKNPKKVTSRITIRTLGTMAHHDNECISGITKGKGKKGSGKGFGKQFQGYCNTCGMWGHKAIDCKSEGKGKDSTRWYHGNKGKGLSKGGTKGFTKGKGKGMNNCEQGQRRLAGDTIFPRLVVT